MRQYNLRYLAFLIEMLIKMHFILRYRRTFMGYVWTLLNPAASMLMLAVIFSNIFQQSFSEFSVFFVAGMIPWIYISSAVGQGSESLISNANILQKVFIPKFIFPLSTSIALLIDAIASMIFFIFFLSLLGNVFSFALLSLIPSYILLLIFVIGITFAVSSLTVVLNDLKYIIPNLIQFLFFISPILYEATRFGDSFVSIIIQFNPVSTYISLFRIAIQDGLIPPWDVYGSAILLSLTSLLVGSLVMSNLSNKLIYKL